MIDHSRRKFNKVLVGSIAILPLSALLSSRQAVAAAVDPASALAKSLKFVLESEKENQSCSGCLFFSTVDDEKGKCIIFGNNEVPVNGWCTSFQKKKTT